MKKTLALLIATTGLTAILAMPSFSAIQESFDLSTRAAGSTADAPQDVSASILVSDNDDDDDENEGKRRHHSRDDDDEDGDDDDGDDCDDDKDCTGAKNPSPAGNVSPPDNGLFDKGKMPKVEVN